MVAGQLAAAGAQALRLALRIASLSDAKDNLAAVLESRTTIDTAVGIIMAQNRCTRDHAFQILASASSHRNVKLREVASGIVANISGERNMRAAFDE